MNGQCDKYYKGGAEGFCHRGCLVTVSINVLGKRNSAMPVAVVTIMSTIGNFGGDNVGDRRGTNQAAETVPGIEGEWKTIFILRGS